MTPIGPDRHNGKTSARLLKDFKTFVARVRQKYPKIVIAFSSATPGPGRWEEAAKRQKANEAIRRYVATQENLRFIDLWDAMLTSDGKLARTSG